MNCSKCDSEMVCETMALSNPPKKIHECKNCGNVVYEDFMQSANICQSEIGFTCAICGESQHINYYSLVIFPVCDKCKSDLKKFVLSKREAIPE